MTLAPRRLVSMPPVRPPFSTSSSWVKSSLPFPPLVRLVSTLLSHHFFSSGCFLFRDLMSGMGGTLHCLVKTGATCHGRKNPVSRDLCLSSGRNWRTRAWQRSGGQGRWAARPLPPSECLLARQQPRPNSRPNSCWNPPGKLYPIFEYFSGGKTASAPRYHRLHRQRERPASSLPPTSP